MDQQSCNDSGDQNCKFPATQNSSEFLVPDETEVSGQPKQLNQLALSSSRGITQTTNDTSKSLSMETSKQSTPHTAECFLNNRSEVHENGVEGSENHQKEFLYKAHLDGEGAGNVRKFLHQNGQDFLESYESDDELLFSRNSFDDEGKENVVKPIENNNGFPFYQNHLLSDPHAINATAQDHDLNFGIVQEVGIASAKEDDDASQSSLKKSSNVKLSKSKNTRGQKKRGPKPSVTNPNVQPVQLKIFNDNNRCHNEWDLKMRRDLERTSEQDLDDLQFQNIKSDFDFGDYFRSSTENDSPYVSDSIKDANDIVPDFWFNPEYNEVINTFKMENPGLIQNDMHNFWIQSELMTLFECPPIDIAQPSTSEQNVARQMKKSIADPQKKLKTMNTVPSFQTFASKKSSPFNSSTQMGSENESEDEYSESQNERERRRRPRNIQNEALNVVINRTVPDLPLQPQPRQAEVNIKIEIEVGAEEVDADANVEVEASQPQLPLEKTKIRTYFFTVVINRMFTLLKDRDLGKDFRAAIKQEAWFKYLVKRTSWLECVLQAAHQNYEIVIQNKEHCHQAIKIVEWYEKARQIEELDQETLQRCQEAFVLVKAFQATQQCQEEMKYKWFQEAMRWRNFQSVICSKKWAQVNKKTLPKDQCDKCCQYYKCDECCEFEHLCTFLHAIYKKGINEKGEERGEIRSLEKLSEIVGNERFSEAYHVCEMDLEEFCQKAGSSVMAIFLKEGEKFYKTSIQELYDPGRNSKKQPDVSKIVDDDEKRRLYLRYQSDIEKRFATPMNYPKISAKK